MIMITEKLAHYFDDYDDLPWFTSQKSFFAARNLLNYQRSGIS